MLGNCEDSPSFTGTRRTVGGREDNNGVRVLPARSKVLHLQEGEVERLIKIMGSSPPWRDGDWFIEGYDFFPEPFTRRS